MRIGIQCMSEFSSLNLAKRTCPLGLLAVLSRGNPDECIVFNEEVSGDSLATIPRSLARAEVILLSAHCGNIQRSLRLARLMASAGKPVFLGGPEPSMIGPRLLRTHPYITGLVVGAGEATAEFLCSRRGDRPANVFLTANNQDANPFAYSCPATSMDFSRMMIDYERLYDLERHEGLSYLWGNDCAQAGNRCVFCGRLSLGVGYRPATHVWDELLCVYRRGIRFFYNTTDSVTTDVAQFRRFCEAKPAEMEEDVHRVFVNASGVNTELVRALKRLNGVAVIGVESFGRMNATRKAHTGIEDNLRAIGVLAENRVRMVLSFVFGLPGETAETLRETEQGIVGLVQDHGHLFDSIHLSPLLVTTGSPAWRRLMAVPEVRSKYSNREVPFDVIEVTNDYFRHFCHVSREFCIQRIYGLCRAIGAIAPGIRIGAKGILKSEERNDEEGASAVSARPIAS